MCIVAYCALVCITQFESSQLLRLSSIRYTSLSCECKLRGKKNVFSHMPTLDVCLYWLRVRSECVYSVFVKTILLCAFLLAFQQNEKFYLFKSSRLMHLKRCGTLRRVVSVWLLSCCVHITKMLSYRRNVWYCRRHIMANIQRNRFNI